MAAQNSVAPTPNLAPFVTVVAVVAAVVATWFRVPGFLVLAVGVAVASGMSSAPPLTGKKDAAGYPTVGNPGEGVSLRKHQAWKYVSWRVLVPNRDWLLNDPAALRSRLQKVDDNVQRLSGLLPAALAKQSSVLAVVVKLFLFVSWLLIPTVFVTWVGVGLALVAVTLPVESLSVWGVWPGSADILMWGNALFAYVLVIQVDAARRRFAAPQDPRPQIGVAELVDVSRNRGRHLVSVFAIAVIVAAVSVVGALVVVNGFGFAWLIVPTPVAAAGVGVIAAAMVLQSQCLPEALQGWRDTVESREQWGPRWDALKQDPAPFLVAHDRFGPEGALPVMVDTFEAPATLGSVGAVALAPKLVPVMGAGTRLSVLYEEDTDSSGQPIPGSKHPVRFTVVAWPVDTSIDVSTPGVDDKWLRVLFRCAAAKAVETVGYPQMMLTGVDPVFVDDPGDGDGGEDAVGTAAYSTTWASTDVDPAELVAAMSGEFQAFAGCEAIADPAAGPVLYVGSLTAGTTEFTDGELADRFEVLARENAWKPRWHDVLKMGEQQPYIQSALYKQVRLPDGNIVCCQPFMTPQGIQPEQYINAEKERKLQSTLDNAPFVSVIGWDGQGSRPGERHSGAFRVLWSHAPVPQNPASVAPGVGASAAAVKWVLSACVNAGFDAARLPRPEIVSASALTSRSSTEHIWDITLRLYGGVTFQKVKKTLESIRQGMGAVGWVRVTGHPDGMRLVVGAEPESGKVTFARKQSEDVATALDWEQTFVDAGLSSPVDDEAPKLVSVDTLPANKDVQRIVFTLPRGMSVDDFSSPKVVDKLRNGAGKEFINVGSDDDPSQFVLLACDVDPMPVPAPFQWDVLGQDQRAVSFGTNVEGSPVTWRFDLDSHLLVLGQNGSGKGVSMTAMLTDLLISGADVYAADPIKGFNDFIFADDWLKFRATTYADTVAVVRKLVQLLDERKKLNAEHRVSNVKDLPDEVRPPIACLVVDEFTSLVIPDPVAKLSTNASEQDVLAFEESKEINDAKLSISSGIGRILREGRATGLVMILAGQKLTSTELKHIPGGATIKSQMSRLAMGKMSFGDMMSAFNDAVGAQGLLGASVPRGRGIFESTAQAAFSVQTWWAGGDSKQHFQVMKDRISEVRRPLPESDRFDPAPFRPAKQESTKVFGRRIDEPEPEMQSEGADESDEIVDAGVVEGFDFAAALSALDGGGETVETEPSPDTSSVVEAEVTTADDAPPVPTLAPSEPVDSDDDMTSAPDTEVQPTPEGDAFGVVFAPQPATKAEAEAAPVDAESPDRAQSDDDLFESGRARPAVFDDGLF